MSNASYVIDASIVIKLNRDQPRDVYPGPWNRLEQLIEAGRATMPRDACIELERIDDGLDSWAKNFDGFVLESTDPEIMTVATITVQHPDWVQGRQNYADPFLIAQAVRRAAVLVSDEGRSGPGAKDENLKITNVAEEHGVQCMKFVDLARAENWIFGV